MYAEILSRFLKKVKIFAWENGPSPLYSNVLIKNLGKEILLACTDSNNGIQQLVSQLGKPIECDCCVNVFDFSKIIDKIDRTADLNITLKNNRLHITDKNIKTSLATMNEDQIFNIPKYTDWWTIDKEFLNELNYVVPPNDELEAPIIYDTKKLFLGNPKALYYIYTDKCSRSFSIDQKYVKKLFVDNFSSMYITEGRLNLKNDTCRIFVPTFNGKQLMLDPLLKIIESEYVYECKVEVKELEYIYGIVKELSEIEKTYDPKVILDISKDVFNINFYESNFLIKGYLYKQDNNIRLNIPISHLAAIIKKTFVNGSNVISIKLAENSRHFIAKSNNLVFVGGLYRI